MKKAVKIITIAIIFSAMLGFFGSAFADNVAASNKLIVVIDKISDNRMSYDIDRVVTKNSTECYRSPSDAKKSPLAKSLYGINGVTEFDFTRHSIAINKGKAFEWKRLEPQILSKIKEYFKATDLEIKYLP